MMRIFTTVVCCTLLLVQFPAHLSTQESEGKITDLPNLLDPPPKTEQKPEPYTTAPSSQWEYYTYRFFAISFGAFPFSMLLSGIVFDTYRTISFSMQNSRYEAKYMPLFLGGVEKPAYTNDDVTTVLLIGAGISLGVALIDLIISLTTSNYETATRGLFENIQ